jgi:hypothetical protein
MTTRRNFLIAAGGTGAIALLGGCAGRAAPAAPASARAVPDIVLAETSTGLGIVRGGLSLVSNAVATPQGSRLYTTEPLAGNRTALSTVDGVSGRRTGRVELARAWVPRVASPDGTMVALTADGSRGRTHTTIVIADETGERHRLELAGNYEPDAFACDGTGLCVLDWLPPAAPDRYRVKLFNVTGEEVGLYTRDKVPVPPGSEPQMRGERRLAMYSPDARFLYTLYTHQGGAGWDEKTDAFVHTLNLPYGSACCMDLPRPFGTGPAAAHTVTVTPDGQELLVADLSHGKLAFAQTDELEVSAVVPVPTGTGDASSVVSTDGRLLYLGIGPVVHLIDLAHRQPVARWAAGAEVRGLAVSDDGQRLLVGYPGGLSWWDSRTGNLLDRATLPGLTRVVRTL